MAKKQKRKLKAKTKRSSKKTLATKPQKILNSTLYAYVEPANAKHAKTEGKKKFGSFSSYVNALIAKDRGVKFKMGHRKPIPLSKSA